MRLLAGATIALSAGAPALATSLRPEGWVLGSDHYRVADYVSQPYIANGRIGAMLPATGQGYQGDLGPTGWPLYTPRYTGSLLAGFYARHDQMESIAALPTWSTLTLIVDGQRWTPGVPAAQVPHWRQTLDMRRAEVATRALWTPAPDKATALRYDVFADRADQHVAVVRLTVTPHWSGQLAVESLLDGRGARRVSAAGTRFDAARDTISVTVRAEQTDKRASEVAVLTGSPDVQVMARSASDTRQAMSAGERWTFPVRAGVTYTITKYVGIASTDDGADPAAIAQEAAERARQRGWAALLADDTQAWAKLWASRIDVVGNPTMQRRVRASLYSLYASVRAGQAWSIAPTGLSSDNYAGMIFWDAETWMYPSLLALQPSLARSVLDLRYATLAQARRNAAKYGRQGAEWPWSNGPDQHCGEADNCKDTQDHLQTDIALAQWQYYLATGDLAWLRERGWPVIHAVAEFWKGRAQRDAEGRYHIDRVIGSDEYAVHVNDDAMTNAGASRVLTIATQAAALAGARADPAWSDIARHLVVPMDARDGVHAEYAGYDGRKIKQADVALMIYPYEYPMPAAQARADLAYYAARTDPDGPAMTDSVQAIAAMQLRLPGCLPWHYLERSVAPFVRVPFAQFSESRGIKAGDNAGAPAYVFETGAGGFLQTFLYGLTGLRWRSDHLVFKPLLMPQLGTQVLVRGLHYQGRVLDLSLGLAHSAITLRSGAAVSVETPSGEWTLQPGQTREVATARPDRTSAGLAATCSDPANPSPSTAENPR